MSSREDIAGDPVIDPTAAPAVKTPTPAPSFRVTPSGGTAGVGTPPSMFVGRVLADRWEVRLRIGLGGMASVHDGLDLRLGRSVAVKILHLHVAENPDSRERLAREARAIAQLKHENVIEVYDYSSDDPDCTWLVTELVEGASLRQILDRIVRPMPEVAVMIVTEVLRALRAAHQTGVVHRDVKPDNILVGKEGRPKLSDFGIAQIVNEQRMTLTGNLVGSPSYMSPEQANGKRTDHRTDLFSAGILLYRMVTGTLPFRGATAIETIRKVSLGEFTDPSELEPGCAGAVAGIIRRALALEMNERYQSADDMIADCQTVLQDSGLTATWEELPKFFSKPQEYQDALKPRLARELEARGQALLNAGEEGRAIDCFNRALSLGEGSQRTMDVVRELSKRRGKGRFRRLAWASAVGVGTVLAVSIGLVLTDRLLPTDAAPPAVMQQAQPEPERLPAIAPVVVEEKKEEPPPIIAPIVEEKKTTKRARREVSKAKEPERKAVIIAAGLPPVVEEEPKKEEPAPVVEEKPLYGTLQVGGNAWFNVYVDGKLLGEAPKQSKYPLVPGIHKLRAEQPGCAPVEREFTIEPGQTQRLKLKIECN